MTRAFTLMTAMPPTVGHINLIRFTAWLASEVHVVVNTQPGEPYVNERVVALEREINNIGHGNITLHHINKTLPQAPEECDTPEDFWDMWHVLLHGVGYRVGDTLVASEEYGIPLSEYIGARFMPYDPDRELRWTKATDVRNDAYAYWHWMAPEFQKLIRPRITIFGAESTGKSTLSRGLADAVQGQWVYEYARPYLEMVGPEIDTQAMVNIWDGQLAAQNHANEIATDNDAFIIQDTDLFSTVGYWGFWQPESLPQQLELDAQRTKSDLYIVMNSKIPFEEDPIRYGGGVRESDDQYWLDLCVRYNLHYKYMTEETPVSQLDQALKWSTEILDDRINKLHYERSSNA